jgi:hypothetical protein
VQHEDGALAAAVRTGALRAMMLRADSRGSASSSASVGSPRSVAPSRSAISGWRMISR